MLTLDWTLSSDKASFWLICFVRNSQVDSLTFFFLHKPVSFPFSLTLFYITHNAILPAKSGEKCDLALASSQTTADATVL